MVFLYKSAYSKYVHLYYQGIPKVMCYHISQDSNAAALKANYKVQFPQETEHELLFHANAFTHPLVAILRPVDEKTGLNHALLANTENSSLKAVIIRLNWGLIPSWAKDWETADKLRKMTINAVSETVFEKPSFRDSIKFNRCIIPVTGFFEWKHETKSKDPYYIYPKNELHFNLAGIYSIWKDPKSNILYNTFSILTKHANGLMEEIHNIKKRQPIFIQEGHLSEWLNPNLTKSGIIDLFNDQVELDAHRISNLITSRNADSNIPEVTLPLTI